MDAPRNALLHHHDHQTAAGQYGNPQGRWYNVARKAANLKDYGNYPDKNIPGS